MKITLHYSESLVRRSVMAFWKRTFEWKFWTAMVVTSLCALYLAMRGDLSWLVGACGAVVLMGIAVAVVAYTSQLRGSMQRFRNLGAPEATLEFDESHLRVTSEAGASEIPWRTISEVWTFSEFWLVFLSRSQFFTLPMADLDQGTREILISRIVSNGGKVA